MLVQVPEFPNLVNYFAITFYLKINLIITEKYVVYIYEKYFGTLIDCIFSSELFLWDATTIHIRWNMRKSLSSTPN